MSQLRKQGLTLVEMMVVVVLLGIMTACVTLAFSHLHRTARSVLSYHEAHAAARHAFAIFSADVRAATWATTFTNGSLVLVGRDAAAGWIEYRSADGRLVRVKDGIEKTLCEGASDVHVDIGLVYPGDDARFVILNIAYTQPIGRTILTNRFSSTTALRNWRQP